MPGNCPWNSSCPRPQGCSKKCCPGSGAAIHVLRDDRFHGYISGGNPEGLLASVELTSPGEAGRLAPWWPHLERVAVLSETPSWQPWIAEAEGEGWKSAWSRALRTPAGEIAGSVLLLFRTAHPDLREAQGALHEAASLAAAIVEQANLLSELRWHARHDAVTGLHNRSWFEQHLDEVLAVQPGLAALFLFNLDLSRINQVLGYRIGERLLVEAASRIDRSLAAPGSAARIGDHELACAVGALADHEEAVRGAESARDVLSAPFEIEDHTLTVNADAAVCYLGEHGSDAASLLTRARVALTPTAPRMAGVCVFSPEMEEGGADRFEIEQRLRVALSHNEFLLHFQPQIRLQDGKLSGVEALLRWRQDDLGVVSPNVFIPIAEETGLIGAIGEWVLQEAARQGACWLRKFRPLRIGANVSAVQFAAPDFVPSVVACLEHAGLPPELLELEITESLVLSNLNATIRDLHRLRELGILLALDDFGTGQSSLAYLRDLPVYRVKIDRRSCGNPAGRRPPAMLTTARRHGARSGADSDHRRRRETVEQLDVLRELGCEEVQGFLCGKPMPAGDLAQWRENRRPAPFLQVAAERVDLASDERGPRRWDLIRRNQPTIVDQERGQLPKGLAGLRSGRVPTDSRLFALCRCTAVITGGCGLHGIARWDLEESWIRLGLHDVGQVHGG